MQALNDRLNPYKNLQNPHSLGISIPANYLQSDHNQTGRTPRPSAGNPTHRHQNWLRLTMEFLAVTFNHSSTKAQQDFKKQTFNVCFRNKTTAQSVPT